MIRVFKIISLKDTNKNTTAKKTKKASKNTLIVSRFQWNARITAAGKNIIAKNITICFLFVSLNLFIWFLYT
jgi:hypothetical protein